MKSSLRHTIHQILLPSGIKKLFTILYLLSAICYLQSQPVQQVWTARYNGPDNMNDAVSAMAMDSSGNIIITGTIQTQTQNANYCTVKYNSSGVQQWVAIYNGIGTNSIDAPTAIGVDQQNNIYVTGYSERSGFGTDDYCIIKYNSNGIQQ